jgi:hypothetical protein
LDGGNEILHGLAALLDGVADQAHTAQLSGDVDSGYVGLEIGIDGGDIDAPLRGAEHELDRIHRAGRFAGAMTDAIRWCDQVGFAADHAQYIVFGVLGTGVDARLTTNADVVIDDGMQ